MPRKKSSGDGKDLGGDQVATGEEASGSSLETPEESATAQADENGAADQGKGSPKSGSPGPEESATTESEPTETVSMLALDTFVRHSGRVQTSGGTFTATLGECADYESRKVARRG